MITSSSPGAQGTTGLTVQGPIGLKGSEGTNGRNGATVTILAVTTNGNLLYWNGTSWVVIPIGSTGQNLKVVSSFQALA